VKPLLLSLVLLAACRGESRPPAPGPAAPPPVVAPSKGTAPKPVVTDVTAEDYVMPRLPKATVVLAGVGGKALKVDTEVASTRDARTRGLMWRYALPDGTGMLFIFAKQQPLSFWMRNTLIPLDMLFIDAEGEVVSIIENAEPRTLTSRPATGPATYVLEVPGGWTKTNGVKAGSKVRFEGISTIVPED
jgi:uncharacterized protein